MGSPVDDAHAAAADDAVYPVAGDLGQFDLPADHLHCRAPAMAPTPPRPSPFVKTIVSRRHGLAQTPLMAPPGREGGPACGSVSALTNCSSCLVVQHSNTPSQNG